MIKTIPKKRYMAMRNRGEVFVCYYHDGEEGSVIRWAFDLAKDRDTTVSYGDVTQIIKRLKKTMILVT